MASNAFPRLSSPLSEIEDIYDIIVIGSGYGGSIAASRGARAGQKVCLLERGKEWLPGDFPEGFLDAAGHVQITYEGKKEVFGDPTDLYEFNVNKDITVVQGCGLGGGSLINANVGLDVDSRVFSLPEWPEELRKDMDKLMTEDKQHVMEMLRPNVYPDWYPPLPKMKAMQTAAQKLSGNNIADVEDLGSLYIKTPLYINFDGSKPNHVGIHQPACNGCGNCCGGCNTGAKNTLNMNYIPDAVAHGAHVFTQIEVTAVLKDSFTSLWKVHFCRKIPDGGFELKEQSVRARYVIIGAGALGSSKILLKSKARGLDISDKIGHRFSGNGDVIGYCYQADKELNAIGTETGLYDKVHHWSPGPTITAAIDLRKVKGEKLKDGMIIEDGTSPSVVKVPYSVTMAIANKLIGVKSVTNQKTWHKLYEKIKGKAMDKTMAFLAMSHDDSEGEIWLDPKTSQAHIKWDGVGRQKNFEKVNAKMEQIALEMGGSFIRNPMWSDSFGKDVICAHPLGGCPMGKHGKEAVVNHKGQVFVGDSSEVYPNLLVMDGSIIPGSVGVNPTMAISMISERCCRLLAEDAGWQIDYALNKHLDETAFLKRKPGLRFTERMAGSVDLVLDDKKKSTKTVPCEFTVTIETQDLDNMLNHDMSHSAELTGTVSCPGLSARPLQIQEGGKFQLFKESEELVDAKEMIYSMDLLSDEGKTYRFEGVKIIKKDHLGEIGLEDTTKLFVKLYEMVNYHKKQIADGILRIHFFDFMKQIQTIEILNVKSELEQLKWKAKFSNFFSKTLWETYSGFHGSALFDPSAPPRYKRKLKIGNIVPEVFFVTTEDKVDLKLTRYKGGGKGPLLVSPGMAMTARAFALDTVDENLVEFLTKHSYDVWLFDWRGSIDLPWANRGQYSIDEIGYYDFPAAVDKLLEVTGEKDVQILAHCVSSLSLFCCLLRGRLEGKVRSVITSQVSATPVGTNFNKFKSYLHIPGFLKDVAHVEAITAYTDVNASIGDKVFNSFTKLVADVVSKSDETCSSDVCHRLTAVYGLLWEHENLNVRTHDILHELFGSGSQSLFTHLSRLFRKEKLVSAQGKDIYLPGMEKKNRLKNQKYMTNLKHLDIPICFYHGEKNCVFDSQSHVRTRKLLMEAFPNQHYELFEMKGYGHLDGFLGKNASKDVFPRLLDFLDKYAENNIVRNSNVMAKMNRILNKMKFITVGKHGCDLVDGNIYNRQRVNSTNSVEIEIDEVCSSKIIPMLEDGPFSKLDELVENLERVLPSDREQVWKRKEKVNSMFNREPEYFHPVGNDAAEVVVENVFLRDETEKREIFVLSDLHLGGHWSHCIKDRLVEFCQALSQVARYYCHTLVLLGDILDMWQTPISTSPLTGSELIAKWKEDKVISFFAEAIRDISEKDVKVFYLTGNHDHEMTEEDVHAMFGDKVRYINGKLIYVINNGDVKYRVRFEHGHDYDLYNSYSILPDNFPGKKHPLGYYITRCVASSVETYMNDSEKVIEEILHFLLTSISSSLLGSSLIDLLSHTGLSKEISESLLERALDRNITEKDAILMDEDRSYLRLHDIMEYPLIHEISKKHGSTRTFSMLKAALGNWDDFLCEFSEDVVVMGHSHKWKNEVLQGKHGPLYYLNSGTFIDFAEYFSYVKITPPKKGQDGLLEVSYKCNNLSPSARKPIRHSLQIPSG